MKLAILAMGAAVVLSCNNAAEKAENTVDTTATATTAVPADSKPSEWIPVDSATAMRTMMEVGAPGPEHEMLAKSNGNWKAEVTMWYTPDGPPQVSKASVTNKMIMGGRYQQSTFKGVMMGNFPFEGTGITGYDKARKVWTSSWVDNMSTMIMNMDGTWDEATKSIVYTGKMLCPANGQMCEMKQVVKKIDDKTEIMEMYGPDMKTGKSYKNMEMKLTKI